jgi:hypothetical protein
MHILILDGDGSHVILEVIKKHKNLVKHGDFIIIHILGIASLQCELFQAFQDWI